MRVGLIGMNYKLLGLEFRERFAREAKNMLEGDFHVSSGIPFVLLSTCNRTEIYFSTEDLAEGHSRILAKLKQEIGDFADHHLYSYFGEECFNHLAEVTTGADSVIFGETEIQRQVKESYEKASFSQNLPSCLHFMFQKSLKIGKEVRTSFSLPKSHVSLESTLSDLIRYFFGSKKDASILFVGFSEINRKIISFLKKKGFVNLYLTTRNKEAAEKNSFDLSCQFVDWLNISYWPKFDIVITGSLASQYLLRQDHLLGKEPCLIQTRLVIDLSVPRNVDPLVGKHPSILLFNMEEVNFFIDQKQRGIHKEKEKLKKKIVESVSLQLDLYRDKKNKVFVCA